MECTSATAIEGKQWFRGCLFRRLATMDRPPCRENVVVDPDYGNGGNFLIPNLLQILQAVVRAFGTSVTPKPFLVARLSPMTGSGTSSRLHILHC